MAAIFYAAKPADEDHAFGHSSAEDLAALGQAVFIVISAGVIAWAAVARLLDPAPGLAAEEVGQLQRTHRVMRTELHRLVDALPDESLPAAEILLRRAQDPVAAKLDAEQQGS